MVIVSKQPILLMMLSFLSACSPFPESTQPNSIGAYAQDSGVLDKNSISTWNPQGIPANKKGWVYDNRIDDFRPKVGTHQMRDWVLNRVASDLITHSLTHWSIKILDPDQSSFAGAVVSETVPRYLLTKIDTTLEIGCPHIPDMVRDTMRVGLMSVVIGKPNTFVKNFVRNRSLAYLEEYHPDVEDKVYAGFFIYDVAKYLTEKNKI